METVLIADDEINIREGLKNIIDWNELGFEVCAEAANGEEALCLILDKKPSLVLLDIRMPKIYGTDLIRMARERGFQGRFIILSGYSDFTYAQTAIQYGVDFYITKPIDEDELQLAICKIKKELDEEHAVSENMELLKSQGCHPSRDRYRKLSDSRRRPFIPAGNRGDESVCRVLPGSDL